MKRLDEGKVSLVEFLRSIKYRRQTAASDQEKCPKHFASFNSQTSSEQRSSAEDSHLIRSAN